MPTFRVTDPTTGQVLRLTGDSPPTEQELEQIFAQQAPAPQIQPQVPSVAPQVPVVPVSPAIQPQVPLEQQPVQQVPVQQQIGGQDVISGDISDIPVDTVSAPVPERLDFFGAGIIEPALTLTTGAIAEPIAGVAGILQSLNPFVEEGAGARAVENVREAITILPKTQAGQQALQSVGELLQPVTETLQKAEQVLGDETFEITNSPALAAAATTIPTALIEALGIASAKGALKTTRKIKLASQQRQAKRAIVNAAPEIDQLKDVSRAIYKELDNSGVTLQPKAFRGLVNRVDNAVKKGGFDPDLTPKTAAVLKRLESELGKSKTLTEIDTLRKVAQNAASALEPADARLGGIIVDNIDQFLDVVSPTAFKKGTVKAADVTPKFKVARELWGRARRSELINEAFTKAGRQASGFENGIVTQFRSILNNKKKSRFFKPAEIKAMDLVVKGTTTANIAKAIGRLGFSEGHATNLIGGSIGIAAGAKLGGPVGAVAVPLIGQVSKKLAQRLTRKNAEFADIIVRAGTNADDIAIAYLRNTPKSLRSSVELSELLSRPDIALDKLIINQSNLFREAAEIARGNQVIASVLTVPGVLEAAQQEQQ